MKKSAAEPSVWRLTCASVVLVSALGCRGPHTAPSPGDGSPTASVGVPSPKHVEGDVMVDSPARGRLVVGWRSAAEQREVDAGNMSMRTARDMMERWKVGDEVDFEKTPRVHYVIADAPLDATAVIVLDVARDFWPTVFGGGTGRMGSSKPGGGDVKLAANRARPVEAEPCSGPRFKLLEIPSRGLPASKATHADAGAKGGTRRFCAWLPESWSTKPERRYPVVYLLPGLLSTEMAYLRGRKSAASRVDGISAELGREVILVGVDTSTPLGSTYLEDSPVTGAWDTFLAKHALPEVERVLRVIPRRTARALIGQSTGGYNALSYGIRHSDTFSVIGSSAPDAADMEAWLVEPSANPGSRRRAREWIRKWAAFEAKLGGPGQITSYAADFAASARAEWPFELSSGEIDETVLARWVDKTPRGLLRDPKSIARLKKDLSGRILITVGRNDEFELFAPAERFAKQLGDAGIEAKFVPTDQGHGDGLERIETCLRFALERLEQ